MASSETVYPVGQSKVLRRMSIRRRSSSWVSSPEDAHIQENRNFTLPVITREEIDQIRGVILLLHGLNERSWDKYTSWAEELCLRTGYAVMMVPSAFHMDRAPVSWSNIRKMKPLETSRKQQARKQGRDDASVSFLNAAISSRIEELPQRFVTSGYQTMEDISSLIIDIRRGRIIPGLSKTLPVHLFCYSIGCTIAQALLICDAQFPANRRLLPPSSRVVLFCGGAVLTESNPVSPYILDEASSSVLSSFLHRFAAGTSDALASIPRAVRRSSLWLRSLQSLCTPAGLQKFRLDTLAESSRQCLYIPMDTDGVFSPEAVYRTVGLLPVQTYQFSPDYPNDHVRPFPVGANTENGFQSVFSSAASWYVR